MPSFLPVQMPAMPSGHMTSGSLGIEGVVTAAEVASASVTRPPPPVVEELEAPPVSEGPETLPHADMSAVRYPSTTRRRRRAREEPRNVLMLVSIQRGKRGGMCACARIFTCVWFDVYTTLLPAWKTELEISSSSVFSWTTATLSDCHRRSLNLFDWLSLKRDLGRPRRYRGESK